MFQPSRISSEAPEVVCGPEVVPRPTSPEEIALSPRSANAQKHTSTSASTWQEGDDQSTDAGSRTLEQRELYQHDNEPPPQTSTIERKWRRRRIMVTAAMVAVAFLAGGGIGGGVGSSIASKKTRFVPNCSEEEFNLTPSADLQSQSRHRAQTQRKL